jgi:hypothetical protein
MERDGGPLPRAHHSNFVWRLEPKSIIGLADMDFLPNKVVAPFCLQSIPFLSLSLSLSLS